MRVLAGIALLSFALSASAEWAVQFGLEVRRVVDDEAHTFIRQGISCTLSATEFKRVLKEEIWQARSLTCDLGADAKAQMHLTCAPDESRSGEMTVTKGKAEVSPFFQCYKKNSTRTPP